LTKRDEDGAVIQAGFMVPSGDIDFFLPWMYSNGGQFYTSDKRHCAFNAPPMREAMQFCQDLQCRDKVSFPMATDLTSDRQDFQLFLQGKVAMFVNGTWAGQIIERQAPGLRFMMTSFPQGPRGTGRGGMAWSNMVCIPMAAKKPEAAWQFIVHQAGIQDCLLRLKTMNRNAPLAALYETPKWHEAVQQHAWLRLVPHITEAAGEYPVIRFTEISAVFHPLCQGLMLNTLTPQQVLDEAEAKVSKILDRYYAQLEAAYR